VLREAVPACGLSEHQLVPVVHPLLGRPRSRVGKHGSGERFPARPRLERVREQVAHRVAVLDAVRVQVRLPVDEHVVLALVDRNAATTRPPAVADRPLDGGVVIAHDRDRAPGQQGQEVSPSDIVA